RVQKGNFKAHLLAPFFIGLWFGHRDTARWSTPSTRFAKQCFLSAPDSSRRLNSAVQPARNRWIKKETTRLHAHRKMPKCFLAALSCELREGARRKMFWYAT